MVRIHRVMRQAGSKPGTQKRRNKMLATEMKVVVIARDLTDKQVSDWPRDTYAGTWVTVEEFRAQSTKETQRITLRSGDVWRMRSVHGFADCVILGFNTRDEAMVVRPYCYASLTGTSCPSPLVGTETIKAVPVAQIVQYWINTGSKMVL